MFADTILGMGRTSIFESAVDPEIDAISVDTVEECAGDPFEFLTGAYYENEMNMVNINQAVMVCEYTYLKETGTEMVYEANVVSTMFGKVRAAMSKAWHKICEFFKSVFAWLESAVRSDKKFVEKYRSKIKDISSVKLANEIKGYAYGADGKADAKVDTMATRMLLSIKATAGQYDTAADKDTKTEDVLNSIRGSLVAESSVEASDFNEKLSKYFRGAEKTFSTVSGSDLSKMLDVIASTKKTKSELNVVYKGAKAAIDGLLKAAKAAEKDAKVKDDGTKDNDSDTAKGWHISATILNTLTSMTTQVNNKAVKAITAHNRQCKAIVTKAVVKYESDKKNNKSDNTPLGIEMKSESASFVDSVFESILG